MDRKERRRETGNRTEQNRTQNELKTRNEELFHQAILDYLAFQIWNLNFPPLP